MYVVTVGSCVLVRCWVQASCIVEARLGNAPWIAGSQVCRRVVMRCHQLQSACKLLQDGFDPNKTIGLRDSTLNAAHAHSLHVVTLVTTCQCITQSTLGQLKHPQQDTVDDWPGVLTTQAWLIVCTACNWKYEKHANVLLLTLCSEPGICCRRASTSMCCWFTTGGSRRVGSFGGLITCQLAVPDSI